MTYREWVIYQMELAIQNEKQAKLKDYYKVLEDRFGVPSWVHTMPRITIKH